MKVDPKQHYGENYFYPNYKEYTDQFGVQRKYYGPAREWHGFGEVASWIQKEFNPATILDIGCSAGSFVSYARGLGILCKGVDISRYAIDNCVDGARGHVSVSDITTQKPIMKDVDLVTATDLMEHIYSTDLDAVIKYIKSALRSNGKFFACIATTRHKSQQWMHTGPNDEVPSDKRWLAVSGHVTVMPLPFWIDLFEANGFKTLYSEMAKFQLWKDYESDLRDIAAWSIMNVYIGEKS